MSKVMFRDYAGRHIFSWSATGALTELAALPFERGLQIPRWCPVNPSVIYYLKDSNNRCGGIPLAGQTSLSAPSPSMLASTPTAVHWTATRKTCQTTENTSRLSALLLEGKSRLSVTTSPITSSLPFWFAPINPTGYVSPLGNYVLILWNAYGTGTYEGLRAYNISTMAPAGDVFDYTGHCDLTVDYDGYEYCIIDASGTYLPGAGARIFKSRIPNGYSTSTCILNYESTNNGYVGSHTSCRNIRNHGERITTPWLASTPKKIPRLV